MESRVFFPNLATALHVKRFKQRDLAIALKIGEATLNRKLHLPGLLTQSEREVIARALGCNSTWLFTEGVVPASARVETAMLSLDGVEKR
jgi:hypothetical protein